MGLSSADRKGGCASAEANLDPPRLLPSASSGEENACEVFPSTCSALRSGGDANFPSGCFLCSLPSPAWQRPSHPPHLSGPPTPSQGLGLLLSAPPAPAGPLSLNSLGTAPMIMSFLSTRLVVSRPYSPRWLMSTLESLLHLGGPLI